MKIFIKGKRINLLKIDHDLIIEQLKKSKILDYSKPRPKIEHINVDGFSIRTILKPNNKITEKNIFKRYSFPNDISFKLANSNYFNNSALELNRVRTIHRLIHKTIPIKIRELKLKITGFNKFSKSYAKNILKTKTKLKEERLFLKELRLEFKYRKKIAYHISNILIPSFYIIYRKKEKLIQAKWFFMGKEQKRIHLGMYSKLKSYDKKKLRNMAIRLVREKYNEPLDKLTYTWIKKERTRLKKWKNQIKQSNKIQY